MDPALWELAQEGADGERVSVMMRLTDPTVVPEGVEVVSRFGPIVTARLATEAIRETWESAKVVSIKAPRRLYGTPLEVLEHVDEAEAGPAGDPARAFDGPEDGRGVVVGFCDWGFDVTCENFRRDDGSTRVLALWDQRGEGDPRAPDPFGYGRVHTRADIDRALASDDPQEALGYHASSGDPSDSGAHGTHVADIAVGNRREPGSVAGVAGGADIVFVHLGAERLGELQDFGDSVRLLEGFDFILRQAGDRPCVLHVSAGRTGGGHLGKSLLEQAIDHLLRARPGTALVQSVGNYAAAAMHTHARLGPGQRHTLDWEIGARDRTANELEVWYSGDDVFDLTLVAPDGRSFTAALGTRSVIQPELVPWGKLYHREREPNTGCNHIDVFLYPAAPKGVWKVVLGGRDVVDGRLHAWIERDAGGPHQSRFAEGQATSRYTTNTISNSLHAIAVGAYDASQAHRPPARFSSRGPTADGRQKPELAAPGYRIRAARSTPRAGWQGQSKLCVKSGTSMAAPVVSGTVALMYQAAGRALTIHELRRILVGSLDALPGPAGRSSTQLGYGYLNVTAAVAAARTLGEPRAQHATASPPFVAPATKTVEAHDGWAPLWVDDVVLPDLKSSEDVEDHEDASDEDDESDDALAEDDAAHESCGCGGHARQELDLEQLHDLLGARDGA